MSENKQFYTDFAHEVSSLYDSFRRVGFDYEQSFELVKICISNPNRDNSFYTQLELRCRNDNLKSALRNLHICKEGEEKDD